MAVRRLCDGCAMAVRWLCDGCVTLLWPQMGGMMPQQAAMGGMAMMGGMPQGGAMMQRTMSSPMQMGGMQVRVSLLGPGGVPPETHRVPLSRQADGCLLYHSLPP